MLRAKAVMIFAIEEDLLSDCDRESRRTGLVKTGEHTCKHTIGVRILMSPEGPELKQRWPRRLFRNATHTNENTGPLVSTVWYGSSFAAHLTYH